MQTAHATCKRGQSHAVSANSYQLTPANTGNAFAFVDLRCNMRFTSASTCPTEMSCMQTLLSHGENRWLTALTQGLHEMPAQITCELDPNGPNSSGVSGPNNTTESTVVIDEKWPGPLSLVTKILEIQ